jgi:hypothetical protein
MRGWVGCEVDANPPARARESESVAQDLGAGYLNAEQCAGAKAVAGGCERGWVHMCGSTHARTQAHTDARTHAVMHARMHTDTHTYTRARARTHT